MHGVPGSREERLKGGHQEGQAPGLAVGEPLVGEELVARAHF